MPSLPPSLFRFCSRLFIAVYGRFPLLGELRSSIAVIRRGELFLLQHRSDGLGFAFPGGTAWFWESEEQTLRREVREETGLQIEAPRRIFLYRDRHFIPSRITVFTAEAKGELHGSWEGEVGWHSLQEVQAEFFVAQRPVLEHLAVHSRS